MPLASDGLSCSGTALWREIRAGLVLLPPEACLRLKRPSSGYALVLPRLVRVAGLGLLDFRGAQVRRYKPGGLWVCALTPACGSVRERSRRDFQGLVLARSGCWRHGG